MTAPVQSLHDGSHQAAPDRRRIDMGDDALGNQVQRGRLQPDRVGAWTRRRVVHEIDRDQIRTGGNRPGRVAGVDEPTGDTVDDRTNGAARMERTAQGERVSTDDPQQIGSGDHRGNRESLVEMRAKIEFVDVEAEACDLVHLVRDDVITLSTGKVIDRVRDDERTTTACVLGEQVRGGSQTLRTEVQEHPCTLGSTGTFVPRITVMSVRVYTGPHSDRGRPRTAWQRGLPWVFAALAVIVTVVATFTEGTVQGASIAVAMLFASAAAASHAVVARGWGWGAGFLAITIGAAFVVENLSVHRAFPFGDLAYESSLGPALFHVPVVVVLAWVSITYPTLLAAQRLSEERLTTAAIGAVALASVDLLWDPLFTANGHVTWSDAGWSLPGLSPLPLQDPLGWLLVGFLLTLALDRLPRKTVKDALPVTMLSWLFVWGIVANVVTMHSFAAVAWGGIGLALVVLPWWWRVWSEPQW